MFLFAAQNGDLWLCGNKSMGWYHDKKWQSPALAARPLPENAACLAEMSEGRLWCGIRDKIWEFDGKNWRLIQSGFDRVNAILKAHDASLWIASANGLHRYFIVPGWRIILRKGFPPMPSSAICQDAGGRFWAGTARGLSLYHPEADPDPPRTYVRDLPDAKNNVPEHAVVTVSFNAEDRWKYTPKDRLLFSYRLDQKEWSPLQEEKNVFFSDLPARQTLLPSPQHGSQLES